MKGTIVNVQKYSVHDGPGIRTTIFFKGCPLKCWWCHNPENISLEEEMMSCEDKCTKCGRCIKICTSFGYNCNKIKKKEILFFIDFY